MKTTERLQISHVHADRKPPGAQKVTHLLAAVLVFSVTMVAVPETATAQVELPGLTAGRGVTAVSGRIVGPNGLGLVQVRVTDNATKTYTDANGRFLLSPVPIGKSVVQIDGRHVGSGDGVDYGFYEVQVIAQAGETTPLGYTSWLTPIDHADDVDLSSLTAREVIVTTPEIPGLELHIAPGTVIRDADGAAVTKASLTQVPPARQPYPGPPDRNQRIAFTIQPGGACLYNANGGIGYAWIVYPNYHHQLPRAREGFMRYEPDNNGWRTYGVGTVNADATQVIPDAGVVITDFASAECDPRTRSHPLIITMPDGRRAAQ